MEACKKIRAIIIAGILGMVIALCSYSGSVFVKASSDGKLNNGVADISTQYLNARVKFGYNGNVKICSVMPVRVQIDNKGPDYKGIFRIVFRNNQKKTILQKKFSVKNNSKVKLNFKLPVMFYSENYIIALCDSRGNDISYKTVEINSPDAKSYIYTGIISDKSSKLGYFNQIFSESEESAAVNGINGRVFDIKASDFNSIDNLSLIDLIVAEDYDVTKFSDRMKGNLKAWISNGGTFLIEREHDNQYDISKFLEYLIDGKSAENLGENYISKINIGKGNLLVSDFCLELPKEVWKSYGYNIIQGVKENLSENKKFELKNGDYSILAGDTVSDYRFDALKINPDDGLPNLKLYGIILLVYIAIVGPVMFIYYKKKGRTTRLWIMVPAVALVFSFIIYILGTSTRIQKPYINYLSQIQLDNTDGEHNADTIFCVTNVNNGQYEIPINKKCSIVPVNLSIYYDTPGKYSSGYDYGVDCTDGNAKLMINKLSGFERAGFLSKHKTDVTGNIDIDIEKDDKKIFGKITNRLSYDLKNCVVYYNGNLVKIGDMTAGETVEIDKVKSSFYMAEDYEFAIEKQIHDALGADLYDTSQDSSTRRKCGLFEAYLSENENDTPLFYGFISNVKNGFSEMFDFNSLGETGVCRQFDIKEKVDGYEVIGSLEEYAYEYNKNYTNGYYVYYGSPEEIRVTYRFPDKFKLKEIVYSKETAGNEEFNMAEDAYIEDAFIGSVYVRNKKNDEIIKLFDSGDETVVNNMEDYLNKDGTLTLYYYINTDSSYNIEDYKLPNVKLAGVYER